MPEPVALALTFGSFGDILEAARIAKRIVDLLRKGPTSHRRQALIATLEGMCGDMGRMTLVFNVGQFTDRLRTEVHLCRLLLDEFSAKINSYEAAGFRGLLGRVWMVAMEDKDLASWGAQISERRTALHDLLLSQHGIQLHDVGEQVGRVASQLQYIGSRVDRVAAQVNVSNDATFDVVQSLSRQISHMGSDLQQLRRMSPHDITDPVFFVVDPLGRSITIQLSFCNTFSDLDRILKAYLFGHPEAGARYVDRGDYNIISAEGVVISHAKLRGKVKAGTHVEMSIIKRSAYRPEIRQRCPQCGQTSAKATEGSWVTCAERICGARYQISSVPEIEKATASIIEEISSPQIFGQESQAESFRLVQIFYVCPG
ncbi:hypothetical protein C8J57DRAFT_555338 [Mycena rebaudengoi]|nr:hypothetical protein C8J57DRAFT_555338 [Mycena rebaudengoi]